MQIFVSCFNIKKMKTKIQQKTNPGFTHITHQSFHTYLKEKEEKKIMNLATTKKMMIAAPLKPPTPIYPHFTTSNILIIILKQK